MFPLPKNNASHCFLFLGGDWESWYLIGTLLETNNKRTWKFMVGRWKPRFWGPASWQVRWMLVFGEGETWMNPTLEGNQEKKTTQKMCVWVDHFPNFLPLKRCRICFRTVLWRVYQVYLESWKSLLPLQNGLFPSGWCWKVCIEKWWNWQSNIYVKMGWKKQRLQGIDSWCLFVEKLTGGYKMGP